MRGGGTTRKDSIMVKEIIWGFHYVTTIGVQIMATGIIWLFVIRLIILAEAGERGGVKQAEGK